MPRTRVRIPALAWSVLAIPQLTWVTPLAPDPEEYTPRNPWVLADDPAWTCSAIGNLYFPAGRVQRVRWYTASTTRIGPGDPHGWEKRAELKFDEEDRCLGFESWIMGGPKWREILQPRTADHDERVLSFDRVDPSCWIREPIRDVAGRELATRVTLWTAEGLGGEDGESWIGKEYAYDAAGRLTAIDENDPKNPQNGCRTELARDEQGRVRRIRSEVVDPRRCSTTEFEYDARSRVAFRSFRFDGDRSRRENSYVYDGAGRVIEECATLNGDIERVVLWNHDESGRLRSRWTFDDPPATGRTRQDARTTQETYDGVDRPRSRTVWNDRGQTVEHFRWTYADDSRGNWIRRIPHRLESELHEIVNEYDDVLRVIEYAD
jgi:hypothetical protein